MIKQRLFGFWSYDLFPYIKGAEVEKINEDGSVTPTGYGSYRFYPLKILPLESGKKIYDEIEKIRIEYEKAAKDLKLDYKNRLKKIVPFIDTKA